MDGYFAPRLNDGKHIFVFGSNLQGWHGKGAAQEALRYWGAVYGVGVGRTGKSYAIPTKANPREVLSLIEINGYVTHFLEYASQHSDLIFLVTKIGCGLAGYLETEIAPFFVSAPDNCILPDGWRV
jgi:hypothetical protein